MAQQKYIKQSGGSYLEGLTVEVSAGAADASKIPNTNASGVLDITVTNGIVTSAGAGSAGKLSALDSTGKLDTSVLPVGIAADVVTATATEAIAAGAYCNVYNSTGAKVRNADNSNGRPAHGYVLASVLNAGVATIYLGGPNTQVSARTPGAVQFLGTGGAAVETAPTGTGVLVQQLGVAVAATVVNYGYQPPITLA
jgi:hypothetical protein